MDIYNKKAEITPFIEEQKKQGKTIGFVPTMGALHEGHLSLIKEAKEQTDIVVVSIFVNPTQFNSAEDLQKYPRNFETDAKLLEQHNCDAIFYPSIEEIYPAKDTRVFNLGELDTIMEGQFRPGHFNGVAQVLTRLFDIIPAHKAFFGLKDFQQIAVVKKIVNDLNIPIEIIPCPIIREDSGLALSSRNALLSDEHKQKANIIYKTLSGIKEHKDTNIETLKQRVKNTINEDCLFKVEYFEIVHKDTLETITEIGQNQPAVACIAVWAGNVRLIDNIEISL